MRNTQASTLNNSTVSTRRAHFAPRTRVTERFAQNPRTGRVVSVTRNGLAVVQWSDGTTSAQVTFALTRASEAR